MIRRTIVLKNQPRSYSSTCSYNSSRSNWNHIEKPMMLIILMEIMCYFQSENLTRIKNKYFLNIFDVYVFFAFVSIAATLLCSGI